MLHFFRCKNLACDFIQHLTFRGRAGPRIHDDYDFTRILGFDFRGLGPGLGVVRVNAKKECKVMIFKPPHISANHGADNFVFFPVCDHDGDAFLRQQQHFIDFSTIHALRL
ncbi:hypothetical protein D3C87_1327780 [compost metagenome]